MKKFNMTALLCLFSVSAVAQSLPLDPYEDTAENLAPQIETNAPIESKFKSNNGTWTYKFVLVKPNGEVQALRSQNKDVMVKPASTMKIFTGWWAFQMRARNNSYLSTMLHESNNAMADATASLLGGVNQMRRFYVREGLPLNSNNFNAADGSGLSYENKATCDIEVKLLKKIYDDPGYKEFKVLMARPGQEGTLKNRLKHLRGKVFAKTGTLRATASLTGFMETAQGTVLFCVMADYLKRPVAEARVTIDQMVSNQFNNLKRRR